MNEIMNFLVQLHIQLLVTNRKLLETISIIRELHKVIKVAIAGKFFSNYLSRLIVVIIIIDLRIFKNQKYNYIMWERWINIYLIFKSDIIVYFNVIIWITIQL